VRSSDDSGQISHDSQDANRDLLALRADAKSFEGVAERGPGAHIPSLVSSVRRPSCHVGASPGPSHLRTWRKTLLCLTEVSLH
jgi:hypothetical protein